MMKLKFSVGAIVRLVLGTGNTSVYEGKVASIDDDEVVLIPQLYVANYEWDERWGVSASELNPDVTVDKSEEVHVNRELIASWSYYRVPVWAKKTTFYGGVVRPSEIGEYEPERINYYDDDGICDGKLPMDELKKTKIWAFINKPRAENPEYSDGYPEEDKEDTM